MPQFHNLEVTDIQATTKDAVIVSLMPQGGQNFEFQQGQYLTFRKTFDGEELRRSYSICAGLDDGVLQVGIKRVDGGTFSTWVNEGLSVGDVLESMVPMGKFHAPLHEKSTRHYLLVAAGSGITPILSIAKTVLEREPKSSVTLLYANRAVNTVMFREQLEDLKNTHMTRFNIIHVLSGGGQDVDLLSGRLDAQKCADLFKIMIDVKTVDLAFICGPEDMMKTVAESLQDHGLDENAIKYELFAAAQTGRAKQKANSKSSQDARVSKAVVVLDGARHAIDIEAGTSVLDAALSQNIEVPFACKAGVCSTCMARLVEGEVEMIANHALEDYEVEAGRVLTCQSHARSDTLIVDYDQH